VKRNKISRAFFENLPAALVAGAVTFIVFYAAVRAIPLENEKIFDVRDNTIRLRVVANSDVESDQTLKLQVRDEIIQIAKELFSENEGVEKAAFIAYNNIERIREKAQDTVIERGYDYNVDVTLEKEKCPLRRYSDFTFPAGEYLTLRVDIGDAKGKNWWCVMYPPLCFNIASEESENEAETFLAYGFSQKDLQKLYENTEKTGKIQTRIAALDLIYNIFGK
jgi:stage II sporulation protein R